MKVTLECQTYLLVGATLSSSTMMKMAAFTWKIICLNLEHSSSPNRQLNLSLKWQKLSKLVAVLFLSRSSLTSLNKIVHHFQSNHNKLLMPQMDNSCNHPIVKQLVQRIHSRHHLLKSSFLTSVISLLLHYLLPTSRLNLTNKIM